MDGSYSSLSDGAELSVDRNTPHGQQGPPPRQEEREGSPVRGPSRLLKNWAARLTLEHEFDFCAVERAAGGIHARFGYTDR